ncbi:MAG: hypothetical protein KCHDKBKB_02385 [Elusimicrobia bacterium]|nr:hypothetical protein [Elusimicrobiota bacterium]
MVGRPLINAEIVEMRGDVSSEGVASAGTEMARVGGFGSYITVVPTPTGAVLAANSAFPAKSTALGTIRMECPSSKSVVSPAGIE